MKIEDDLSLMENAYSYIPITGTLRGGVVPLSECPSYPGSQLSGCNCICPQKGAKVGGAVEKKVKFTPILIYIPKSGAIRKRLNRQKVFVLGSFIL